MTLDDLEQIYDQAKADQFNSGKRAGIAAVVSELMEHFVTGASTYAWDADDLHADEAKLLDRLKDQAAALHQTISEAKKSREQSLAITKLEESVMWAVKAITA